LALCALLHASTLCATSLDATFARNGRYVFEMNGGSSIAGSALHQGDGKLVVSGSYRAPGAESRALVFRLNPDGSLDRTFGRDGIVMLDIGLGSEAAAITQQPDGKLLVAGSVTTSSPTRSDFLCVRLNPDGSPDATFGGGTGHVTVDFGDALPGGKAVSASARDIALRPDGSIVLGGAAGGLEHGMLIARLLGDGQRDVSYSGDGRHHEARRPGGYAGQALEDGRTFAAGPAGTDAPVTMLRAADGKFIMVASHADTGTDGTRITIVRALESPEFAFTDATVDARSTASTVLVPVRRIGSTTGPVTLDYATENGTAEAGIHFNGASGTLTWAAGDAETKSITIFLYSTDSRPPTHHFNVILSNPSEGFIRSNKAVVSIRSDLPPEETEGGGPVNNDGGGRTDLWMTAVLLCALVIRMRRRSV
jgi:uncharacterized delta-60 repeat protein